MPNNVIIINDQPDILVVNKNDIDGNALSSHRLSITTQPTISVVSPSSNPNISSIAPNAPPFSSSSNGSPGEIRWDTNNLYICVSKNLWKKISLEEIA